MTWHIVSSPIPLYIFRTTLIFYYLPPIVLLAGWLAGVRNSMFFSLLPVVTTLSDDNLGSYLIG